MLRVDIVRFGRIDTPLGRGLDSDDAVIAAGVITPLGCFGTAEEAAASALYDGACVCWRAGVDEKAANAASSSLPRSSWPSLALHCPRTIHKISSAAATRTLAMIDDPSVVEVVFCSRATISGRHSACFSRRLRTGLGSAR